jgi:hypothetical protein
MENWFNSLPVEFYFDDPTSERTKLYKKIKQQWNRELALSLNAYLCEEDRFKN